MFRRLLVAFDGSVHAQRALSEAIDLAQLNNGRLTVMTVASEPSVWALGSYGAAVDVAGLREQVVRGYQAMLDAAVETCARRRPRRQDPQARRRGTGDRGARHGRR